MKSILTKATATFGQFLVLCGLLAMPKYSEADEAVRALRIATYNASLYGDKSGQVLKRLRTGKDPQASKVATIVQTVRPDILLINEIDYEADGAVADTLAQKYFAVSRGGQKAIHYPHVLAIPSNTGIDSGLDLNRNGQLKEPNDAWGYGTYPGQYAMAVFSRFPIDEENLRTFQKFLWNEMPSALRPVDPKTGQPYYADAVWSELRLSSKNHADVPVKVDGQSIHILASHPTPPVFDGDEDRNGCRNHDEIRFWVEYLNAKADYLVDDGGVSGGLNQKASFVIMGDLNSDPEAGDSRREAIESLIKHPRVTDPQPTSEGGAELPQSSFTGDPARHTAQFGRNRSMRIDYVLPSRQLKLIDSGVFWPKRQSPQYGLIEASDHRMVWIDIALPSSAIPQPSNPKQSDQQ